MSKENKLIEIVAEILEIDADNVSLKTELDEVKWDSLAVITFISEVDSEFEMVVSPQKVSEVRSVQELFELI